MPTTFLVDATPMHAIGGFSVIIVSRSAGEAL